MKDPVFLSSPIYPPFIFTNTSLSTNREDHLISLLSHDDFTFKAQLTSSHLLLQKSLVHTNTGLTMESKSFLYNLTFFAHLYTI